MMRDAQPLKCGAKTPKTGIEIEQSRKVKAHNVPKGPGNRISRMNTPMG
jgi:hypothetical protein